MLILERNDLNNRKVVTVAVKLRKQCDTCLSIVWNDYELILPSKRDLTAISVIWV